MPELGFALDSNNAPASAPLDLSPQGVNSDSPVSAAPAATPAAQADTPSFGSMLSTVTGGPNYKPPDPQSSALDQAAGMLDQRIKRAGQVATNPLAQIFAPEQVEAARAAVPQLTEQLQTIKGQQQHAADIKQTARNWNLTNPNQFGEQATDTTLANEALRQWKDEGNFNAYKALSGLSPEWKNRADLYMPDAMSKFGDHVAAVQDGIKTLNGAAAVNSEQAFTAARDKVIRDNDLGSLGIKPDSIPKTIDEWMARRGSLEAQYNGARRTLNAFNARQDQLNQATPITDEKVAKTVGDTYQFSNGETIPGAKAVSLPGHGDVQGAMLPPNSKDMNNRGKTWSNATPEQVETVNKQLFAHEIKGELNKYKMAREFHDITSNDKMYTTAAGLAVITGRLGAMERDFAEGTEAAGTPGMSKILETKYGTIGGARNALARELSELKEWRAKGGEANPRISKPSIEGIKAVADFVYGEALKEARERTRQPLETAGRYAMTPENLGVNRELLNDPELRKAYDDAKRQSDADLQSYPMIPIGNRAVLLPQGSNVPGAQLGSAYSVQPAPNQQQQNGVTPPSSPTLGGVQQPAPLVPPGGAGSPSATPQPVRIAGADINVPLPLGASPSFVTSLQRIESGNKRDPWTAIPPAGPSGKPISSASGAFQFIDKTWEENKPPGAPARAKDATPEQQAQGLVTLTAKNAAALQAKGLPVNDTNLYIVHNGSAALLQADPSADARTVVGERAAANNPQFFKGRPTVAVALQRYDDAMKTVSGVADVKTPGVMATLGNLATEAAPAIGGTVGAIGGGALGNVPGAVAGGAAGSAAGQSLKDYLQGNPQSPAKIAEQFALGGALGVGGLPRGLNMLARAGGTGAIEAGAEAAKGGEDSDPLAAGVKGAAEGLGGEMFGRALGMVGHKLYSLFAPDAKAAVRAAAKDLHDANETLRTEPDKLPGVAGAAATPNPKYEAAQVAKEKAENTIKEMLPSAKPEEAAYAHKVSSEGVPKQEAQVAKPAALEQQRLGAGYQQLETEVGNKDVGAVKETPKPLQDGPITAVVSGQVPKAFAELATKVENAITAPTANWREKWIDLKDARAALLEKERTAIASTGARKSETAEAYRDLADTVRKQQVKAANAVFGPTEGPKVIDRLKMLDTRYRNLMEATNGGDLTKAARLTGEAGRDADRKFRAFAHDDPTALAAWTAMRKQGANLEKEIKNLVAGEGVPVLGKVYSAVKFLGTFNSWMRERAAGNPAKFSDFINAGDGGARATRNVAGSLGARTAVQTDLPSQAGAALNAAAP